MGCVFAVIPYLPFPIRVHIRLQHYYYSLRDHHQHRRRPRLTAQQHRHFTWLQRPHLQHQSSARASRPGIIAGLWRGARAIWWTGAFTWTVETERAGGPASRSASTHIVVRASALFFPPSVHRQPLSTPDHVIICSY